MRDVKHILIDNRFRFNKALGQNFITDESLLAGIVADSGITASDVAVEIGAGAGTLTRALSDVANYVYAYEIDHNLQPVLAETLAGRDNVEVVFRDFMKTDLSAEEDRIGGDYHVVANLPYYVTTPIIMRFVEEASRCLSITVTVQKEVADRLSAAPGDSEYSAITASIRARADVTVTRYIDRNNFYPVPNVDSAVVRIQPVADKYEGLNADVFRLIKNAFLMRRKTLVNNIVSAYGTTRADTESMLSDLGYDVRIRGERLDIPDFIAISRSLNEMLQA